MAGRGTTGTHAGAHLELVGCLRSSEQNSEAKHARCDTTRRHPDANDTGKATADDRRVEAADQQCG